MIQKINNNSIYLAVESVGAELCSLCDVHGTEYLWQKNKKIWNYSAPLNFLYSNKDKSVNLFKDVKFAVSEKLTDKLTLTFKSCEKTLKAFPYSFIFTASFQLCNDTLIIRFSFKNTGNKTMPADFSFSPAFFIPISEDEKFTDYKISFNKSSTITAIKNGKAVGQKESIKNGVLTLSDEALTQHDILINTQKLTISSLESGRGLELLQSGFGSTLLTRKNGGEYICLNNNVKTEIPPEDEFESMYKITVL